MKKLSAKSYQLKARKGFTLVEVLTVVAILAILFGLSFAAFGVIRPAARDSQRVADLKVIQSALDLYAYDHGSEYPYPTTAAGIYTNSSFNSGYLPSTPKDPLRKTKYVYLAPACLKIGSGTGQDLTTVSQAMNDKYYSSAEELEPGVCPAGAGWLPYVLYVEAERNSPKVNTGSLAASDPTVIIYSSKKPLFPNQ